MNFENLSQLWLIQAPRKYWPFINSQDNYVLPLWMPALAAVAEEEGFSVKAVDCMAEQIGWQSLRQLLATKKPGIVALGEAHALFINETVKLVNLIKEVSPETVVIAGGGHFATQAEPLLLEHPIDFIVIGEGEVTFKELLSALKSHTKDFSAIAGLVFKREGRIHRTAPRPLISDLDTLPLPSFHSMSMNKYGTSKYLFSPDGTTIEHSRGCVFSCGFCVWWVQMADRKAIDGQEKLTPRWRTKSARRTVDEIELLQKKYGKNCFLFVDGTWNVDATWNQDFCEEIFRRRLKINWFGFMRADYLLRDEKSGILEKMVRSGLSHICIGAEHCSSDFLAKLQKKTYSVNTTEEVIKLFKKKYPEVFLQTTFIVGSENESKETIRALGKYVRSLGVDFPAFHILTPVPGTSIFEEAQAENKLEVLDFAQYDWNTPIMSTRFLSREELLYEVYLLYRGSVRLGWLLKGICSRHRYKRNMYIWWFVTTVRVVGSNFKQLIFSPRKAMGLIQPEWYDS